MTPPLEAHCLKRNICCVFWPAFGCCAHLKAGPTFFFSHFQPFFLYFKPFSVISRLKSTKNVVALKNRWIISWIQVWWHLWYSKSMIFERYSRPITEGGQKESHRWDNIKKWYFRPKGFRISLRRISNTLRILSLYKPNIGAIFFFFFFFFKPIRCKIWVPIGIKKNFMYRRFSICYRVNLRLIIPNK